MRKVFLMVLFVIGMITTTFAQDATVNVPIEKTYESYMTDISVGSGATKWVLINTDQHYPTTQDLIIHLDSVSGGAHTTTVKLFGTKFTTEGWTQIGSTVTWKATTADTTIVVSNATAARWRAYKVEVVNASGDVTTIDYLKFKFWRE